MRIPPLTDLDREQEKIYLESPTEGIILVTGPPGSGKTVMAWHRAETLLDEDEEVQLTMYTKVLRQYVASGAKPDWVEVQHVDRWARDWWSHAGFGWLPRRQDVKNRYNPIDWGGIQNRVVEQAGSRKLEKLDWGHLIIDEGQDFSSEMYLALVIIRNVISRTGVCPGLTVFADDNQKIHPIDDSTTREIAEILVPGEWHKPPEKRERLFRLKKNYRNTRQIHALAWHFAVFEEEDGSPPEPPTREGNLPECRLLGGDSEVVQFIKRVCMARPAQEIGIIIPSYRGKHRVKKIYNKLSFNLKETSYCVQAYVSQNARSNSFDPAFSESNLRFDVPNIVTVVTDKSVKGLEFDIVFLLDLESLEVADDGAEESAKNLFVCCSRARSELFLCCVAPGRTPPPILGFLPLRTENLCRYSPTERYAELEPEIQRVEIPKRRIKGRVR